MAEEELEEISAETEAGLSGKTKIIIIVVLGIVLLLAAVVGTMHFLTSSSPDQTAEEGVEESSSEQVAEAFNEGPEIYLELRPHFIVALPAARGQRFLHVYITLMTKDEEAIETVNHHMPKVRNNLNLLLGAQDYKHVQTIRGKEELRMSCLEEIQTILMQEIKRKGIKDIYFTKVFLQ